MWKMRQKTLKNEVSLIQTLTGTKRTAAELSTMQIVGNIRLAKITAYTG
jgi:hypothetical protein